MSCLYKGNIIETQLSKLSNGGTEMMRKRLKDNVDNDILQDFAIHFSRVREIYSDVYNIFYAHDLANDPENKILNNKGWKKFDHFVFVSEWQKQQYIDNFNIPHNKCSVIYNAIELPLNNLPKDTSSLKFIYHTTPHRGLELLYPIFNSLAYHFPFISLDVYSSFKIYGWTQRDSIYKKLFTFIDKHPNMNYHGYQSNEEVLNALEHSHIFLYPCIWQETSCLAMIEAINSGCYIIHPDYGALSETSQHAARTTYHFYEDKIEHSKACYKETYHILKEYERNNDYINNSITKNSTNPFNIKEYKHKWEDILIGIKNNG